MSPPRPPRPEDPDLPAISTGRVAPWNRFEEAALDSGVRRRLFSANRAMIVLCEVSSVSFSRPRVNDLDEVTTVLSGSVELRVGDRLARLGQGQSVRVPARTLHSVRNLGTIPAEVINVLFPPVEPA